ncbi:L-arabinose ABC transporter ATP-binding protein AraG [Vibrio sp. S17_S38]|nr:L-arabinose ABC transporter ATP-binding protein AraG [Vibrio sp. S17_S38]
MIIKKPYVEFKDICQYFPGVKALDGMSFAVNEGSVHALMGENGAGKSTLLKILSGINQPTKGQLIINGESMKFKHETDSLNHGIAIIYQELNLIPELSVAENIFLGQLPTTRGRVNYPLLNSMAKEQLDRLGENIDPAKQVKTLSIGQWQMVEIAKALSRDAKIIAFDEPTSSLSQREISNLFKVIEELRDQGKVIFYVSHRMEEIFRISDALTIFKDGTHVETFYDLSKLTNDRLVKLMVGRELKNIYNYRSRDHGIDGLTVKNLLGPGLSQPASFSIKQGEILGLFGLVGSGRTELTRLLFGAEPREKGEIEIDTFPVTVNSPIDAIKVGITYCPEDRKLSGILPILSVKENMNVTARRNNLQFGSLINEQWEHANADEKVRNLKVKTPNLEQKIGNLSGGNQQKIILGRWLSTHMKVLILDEPTRGIDVGAKSEIYDLIFKLAESGVTILMISSDLPEVLGVSDRIIVMKDGQLSGELERNHFSEESALNLAMLGKKTAELAVEE